MRESILLLVFIACIISCMQIKTKSNKTPKIVQELNDFLSQITQADEFSGVVLLAKDNNIIFQNAYGEANKDFKVKNNLETKFNLGSITKMFTAIAIAQLVEQNKLSFDDKLSKFMPDFPVLDFLKGANFT